MEVTSLDNIPKDMVGKTIPAAKYAVFTHKGSPEGLGKTMDDILGKWLPLADLELGGYTIEVYDERFTGEEKSVFDVYVPVKPLNKGNGAL